MNRLKNSSVANKRRGYIIGIAMVALIVIARKLFLDELLDNGIPLRLFIVPVIAAAWSGGLMPGLLASAVGAVAASYFFGDLSGGTMDWGTMSVFLVIGALISGFMESLHVTRRRLEDRQTQLEHEAAERRKAEIAERAQRDQLTGEIQQRKLTEAALAEREERIRMAVESANIGTWDFSVLTNEHCWSNRAKEMFGLQPDEDVADIPFLELLHPDDRERVNQAIQPAIDPRGDGRYEAEYRARWRDGTIRWIIAKGQTTFEGSGADRRAVRFIGTVFDFSERKLFEQSLKDADRRKDEFLSILAHELRNPLAPMSNALQLWPMIADDPAEMENIRGLMQRQVDHITRLIDDLMDVSRITRGRVELRRQQVDLRVLVNDALESVRPFIVSYRQKVTVAICDEAVQVDGDVARLTQVFGNILNNAVKYTGRNGVIWVSVDKKGGQAVVSIRDNGPGIPPHMLSAIFEMFRQVDDTISRSHGGLGIGLTLVKQLVELHGGTVEAHSAGPGLGSEFIVALPLATVPASDSRIPGPHHRMRQMDSLPRRRVLVVDDIQASAETLAMMLRAIGQDTSIAYDGPTAIDSALSTKPDAVFLDIAMPGMDGYEVARQIRQRANGGPVVLIALTGYGQDEDRRRAFAAGFDHHLVKPASLDGLERILATVPRVETEGELAAPELRPRSSDEGP